MLFVLASALLVSVFSQTTSQPTSTTVDSFPDKFTLVSDGDRYTIQNNCGTTAFPANDAWYCSVSSNKAGLNKDTVGVLKAVVPAGQTITLEFNFAPNIDTSDFGSDADLAVLTESALSDLNCFGCPTQQNAGNLATKLCSDANCANELDTANWSPATISDSDWVHGQDQYLLLTCNPDVSQVYYMKLTNPDSATDSTWFFYPVVDTDGDCSWIAALTKALNGLVTIIIVVLVCVCCCIACAFMFCCGGMALCCAAGASAGNKPDQGVQMNGGAPMTE